MRSTWLFHHIIFKTASCPFRPQNSQFHLLLFSRTIFFIFCHGLSARTEERVMPVEAAMGGQTETGGGSRHYVWFEAEDVQGWERTLQRRTGPWRSSVLGLGHCLRKGEPGDMWCGKLLTGLRFLSGAEGKRKTSWNQAGSVGTVTQTLLFSLCYCSCCSRLITVTRSGRILRIVNLSSPLM